MGATVVLVKRTIFLGVVFGLVGLATTSARADSPAIPISDTGETTRGGALGTGVRSSAAGTSAALYNAANLATSRTYHVDATAQYDPTFKRLSLMTAVADSVSNRIAAGLIARYIISDGNTGYDGWETRVSIGFPLGDGIAIGVSGRYLSYGRTGELSAGQNRKMAEGITADVSLTVTPLPGLRIAAFGYNLADFGTSLIPRLVGGSASYTFDNTFTIGGDVLANLSSHISNAPLLAGGGMEWLAGGSVPLRFGYQWDQLRNMHVVTGGLGYVDPSFGIDFSFRQQVSGGSDSTFLASLRYFVQ